MLTSHQQSAAVESSSQTRDDSVRLLVGTCGEGPCGAAEDVTGGRLGESDLAVVVGEHVVANLACYVAVGSLRVDCEGFGGVAGPD